jgi:phage gp46-like protein
MMSGLDLRIDPLTRDYIFDSSTGTWETTRSAETAVYHQIVGDYGAWVGDPEAGSRFFELARGKSTLKTPAVVADILAECLQPLVDDGRISEPVTNTERQAVDRVAAETTVIDLQTGEELDLVDLLPLDL